MNLRLGEATLIRGKRNSKIYYLPDCPKYDLSNPANVATFTTEHDAQQADYQKTKNYS